MSNWGYNFCSLSIRDDQSSTENDSRNSVSQWNSGASDHASVNERYPT